MKRLFLVALLAVGMVATGSAQKKNVSLAKNKAMNFETPDFDGAKEAIGAALQDETTKNQAETWYVAGLIYQKIIEKDIFNAMTGAATQNTALEGESAIEMYKYYQKAHELDQMPNAKGKVKPKFTKNIQKALLTCYQDMYLVNYGINLYNEQKFEPAIEAFEMHTSIPESTVFADKPDMFVKDTVFYQIRYYTALAYERQKNLQKTLEIFDEIKDKGVQEIYVNQRICDIYKEMGDTANYVRTLEEGYKRYPNEFFFLGNLINHMIFNGQELEGVAYLDKAIEMDPTNAQYYNVKGSVMETLNRMEEAEKYYDKSLELDPNNFKSLTDKARMVYIKGQDLESKSASTRDIKKADEYQLQAIELFKEAVPYFEKAIQVNPNDIETLTNLRRIYYRLMNRDCKYQKDYSRIDAMLKAL